MFIPEQPQFYEAKLGGYLPVMWANNVAVSAAEHPFSFAAIGSLYMYRTTATWYRKVADNRDANDWVDALGGSSGLNPDGSDVGATSQSQVFTNGIVGPTWKPASNGTAALKLQDAAGSNDALVVDTTNSRVGINGLAQAGSTMVVRQNADNAGIRVYGYDDRSTDYFALSINTTGTGSFVTTGNVTFSIGGQMTFVTSTDSVVSFQGSGGAASRVIYANTSTKRVSIGQNITPSAVLDIAASTTSAASLRLRDGADVTSPDNGDIWNDGGDIKVRLGGTTYTLDKTAV